MMRNRKVIIMNSVTQTKHAVLSKNTLTLINGNQWEVRHCDAYSLSGLCELARYSKLSHMWVLPDTGITPDRAYFAQAIGEWDLWATWDIEDEIARTTEQPQLLVSVTGCKRPKGGQHWFSIGFVGQSQWSWVEEDMSPKVLLQTVKYMQEALKVPVGAGTTTVGMKLLQERNSNDERKAWIAPPSIDLSKLHWDETVKDVVWDLRPLPARLPRYLHKLDKNAAYLAACVAEQFGSGTPTHVFHDHGVEEKKFGLWRCELISSSQPLPELPSMWNYEGKEAWLMRPMINLLRTNGYTLHITEGWEWPAQHFTLKSWAQELWDVRQSFKKDTVRWKHTPSRQNACDGMKDIATSTVGLFASDALRQENTRTIERTGKAIWKYRPDWHGEAISRHRAVMFWNMLKVREACGITPLFVYMDALFYASDEYDPYKALPGISWQSGDGLSTDIGKYKHEWTLPLDSDVVSLLKSGERLTDKLSMLNDMAELMKDA